MKHRYIDFYLPRVHQGRRPFTPQRLRGILGAECILIRAPEVRLGARDCGCLYCMLESHLRTRVNYNLWVVISGRQGQIGLRINQ